jgi:hypothetical protein
VQYGTSTGGPMDDINPMLIAIFLIDGALDPLIPPEGNRWPSPLVEPDDRLWNFGFADFIQKRRINGHV